MKLTIYETLSLKRIRRWEREKHRGLQKRLLDLTSRPVEYVIKQIGHETLQAAEEAVQATVEKLLHASNYTVKPEALIKRARAHGIMIEDLSELRRCDLRALDTCNRKQIRFHGRLAAVQGAVLGLGGALAAVADLTAVLVLDFHLIQEVAFCYGFDPNEAVEKEIILRVILAALGASEIKRRCLEEIEELRGEQERTGPGSTTHQLSVVGSKVLQDYIEHLTLCLLVRAVPHLFPIVSAIASAHSNHEMLESSGKTAFMVYRKRFIERKRSL
jgi:hypothetical protein